MSGYDNRKSARPVHFIVLLAVVLLAHLPALFVPFHFDDFHHIAENESVRSISKIPDFFADPGHFTGRTGVEGMYRPLLMASHAITYALLGPEPMGFHLVNLILHLANAALVLSLLGRWTGSGRAALVGALFWALAGIQQETVAYASARSTLLAAFFMLSALRVTDREDAGIGRGAPALLFMLLGLMSKEITFSLPLLMLLRDATLGRAAGWKLKPRLPMLAGLFALMPLYVLFRVFMFESAFHVAYVPRHLYLITQGKSVLYYLWHTLFPVNLTILPNIRVGESVLAPGMALPALAALFILLAGLVSFRRAPWLCFAILWFFICLAPTSSFTPLFLVASVERAYLPLLGLVAGGIRGFDLAFADGGRARRAAVALALAVVCLQAAVTVARHLAWRSRTGVMREMTENAPDRGLGWMWLGMMEVQEDRLDDARAHLLAALRVEPGLLQAEEELAKVDYVASGGKKGREIWERVLADPEVPVPRKVDALIKLAAMDIGERKLDSARSRVTEVLELNPSNSEAYMMLGRVDEADGFRSKAKDNYRKALELFPDYPEVHAQLGRMLLEEGDLGNARGHLEAVIEMKRPWPEVYANLVFLSCREDKLEEAEDWYRSGIDLDPNFGMLYFASGGCLAGAGRLDLARERLGRAVELNPEYGNARAFFAKVCMDLARAEPDGARRDELLGLAAEQIRWLLARDAGDDLRAEWEKTTGRELR